MKMTKILDLNLSWWYLFNSVRLFGKNNVKLIFAFFRVNTIEINGCLVLENNLRFLEVAARW